MSFQARDAVLIGKRGVKLASPDIDRDDMRRTGPQQHVCETTCGRPDVKANAPSRINAKSAQAVRQFQSPSRYVRVRRLCLDAVVA